MLNILKELGQSEAQILMSTTALSLLPDPGIVEPIEIDPIQAKGQQDLLNQIKTHLKIQIEELTEETKIAVLEFIEKEISNQILDKKKEKAARARIGDRGDLRPDLYQVKFSQLFKDTSEKRGIRKHHVEETLMSPDAVQHLTPPKDHENQKQLFSIYSKTFPDQGSSDPYTMLVMAQRKGYIQVVFSAWRIYHSDVDLSGTKTPLDILKGFAETYGIPFSVGGSDKSMFKLFQKIEIPEGQSGTDIFAYEQQKNRKHEIQFLFKKTSSKEIEVSIAFVIDISKYEQDLVKHGVKIYD